MLLSLEGIAKSFSTKENVEAQKVLIDLSFSFSEAESVAILGPSGSGKSTLLNIIGTLVRPDAGTYIYKDADISAYSETELAAFRNTEIGFVFQSHHLLPQCSAYENVLLPTIPHKSSDLEFHKIAEELLRHVGLWEHRNKFPSQLSGGECQRVAVVRALINEPSLLLADEPTGALDKKNSELLVDLLLDLNKSRGLSLLMVTHSEELAARMDRVLTLDEGNLHG